MFDKILNNEKTVDARISTKTNMTIELGSTIKFVCGPRSITRTVVGIMKYRNFKEMLQNEGVKNCLPGVGDLDEAVAYYRDLGNYAALELRHGVLAFRLESKVRF